jgi:capsular polysaccharide transport system permease protein
MSFIVTESWSGVLSPRLQSKLAEFRRVMGAVMIQDMRSRFGTNRLAYLISIGWPLAHITVLTVAYLLRTHIAPLGDSPTMFIVTGLLPYILCLYPGRMMALAVVQNYQLLNIPLIQPFHLILSRCLLEMLNAFVVMAIFLSVLYLFELEIMPAEPGEAAEAVAAAVFLGIGFGFFNVVMCALIGHYFLIFYILVMMVCYIFSGVYIPVSSMPQTIKELVLCNPIFHLVEWLRAGYYVSYDDALLNKLLVISVASVSLTLGLVGERFLRGKFLA